MHITYRAAPPAPKGNDAWTPPSSSRSLRLFSALLLAVLFSVCLDPLAALSAAKPTALDRLVNEFQTLEKDPQKGGRRDLWLNLEQNFDALARKSKGDTAVSAAFHAARSRQELGRRSFLASDHKAAVSRFEVLARKYPKSSLAPRSLYQAATTLEYRLRDHAAAAAALERLLRAYPKCKDAPDAQKLLQQAQKNAAQKAAEPPLAAKEDGAKSAAASSITLRNITWKGASQRAVVTLELDGKADVAHSFVPPNRAKKTPGRLHLDIAGALPADALKAGFRPKNLVVSRISARQGNGGTRVTFECDGVQCYAVNTPKGDTQVIVVELSRKDDIEGGIPTATGSGKQQQDAKRPPQPANVMEQLGLTVQTIMIDAGHGGKDPGAMAGGITERQFTLGMAKRVGALLQKKGFAVVYTRTGNTYIPLQDRPDIANSKNADLFISIHVNANSNKSICGLETYYLDEAKTQDAALVAARENGVSVKNISDLQFILTDLMLSSKLKESRHLAERVHKGILKNVRSKKARAHDNGVRAAPFYVLMGARMPAILVEFGYITNQDDLANLKSERFLQSQAEGLVEGIVQYKADLAKVAPK